MTLDARLIKGVVVERPELRRQATKCADQPELRPDAICAKIEPDVRHELQAVFGFMLRLGQRLSGREKRRG